MTKGFALTKELALWDTSAIMDYTMDRAGSRSAHVDKVAKSEESTGKSHVT